MTGIELIFFIVATMGLWFGFVLKGALITQAHFSSCWAVLTQSEGLFCSLTHHAQLENRLGMHKNLGRGMLGQLTPIDWRAAPHHKTSRSAYKAGGRRRKQGGHVQSYGIWLPKSLLFMMETCFAGDSLASACWWKVVNESFACMCRFCFTYLNVVISACEFSLTLPILSPFPSE